MRSAATLVVIALLFASASMLAEERAPAAPPVSSEEGARAFLDVHRVLTSPRCQNCHPKGDVPLQGDEGRPHAMLVRRGLEDVGMACSTCHRDEPVLLPGAPPGAPHWGLPPKETPMVFEGRTPKQLCEQFKRPADTHGRDLSALLQHVTHDPLVLWGWSPGPGRTSPPLSHDALVAAFARWVDSGGACPER